ncbi:MAG: hypothetical protein B5M46_04250 [Epsilonproteobacteria bacterium 4484_20]|nr:MAG: hypothetical protein B5M46_04250 [Epsilonproteobacteria bacterium 4484_20]
MDVNNSKAYADAHIFSSKKAKEVGLIDEVATKSNAKKQIAELAKVKDPVWKEKDKFESFIESLSTESLLKLQSYFYGLRSTLL